MRQLFTTVLILVSVWATAQCPQAPECTNPVQMSGNLSGNNFQGNTCISGYGTVMPSNSFTQFEFLHFAAAGIIDVNKPITLPGGAKKIWASGSNVNFLQNFVMTDGDTFEIGDLCAASLAQLNANTPSNGQPNVIRLGFGATLYVCGVQHFSGDTIHTVNTTTANPNHDVYVIGCSAGTPLPIYSFKLEGSTISWEAGGDVEVQYSTNAKVWAVRYFTSQKKGSYNVSDAGFYRIISEGWISQVVEYRKKEGMPSDEPIYNAIGQKVDRASIPGLYMQGKRKFIVIK